MSDDPQRLPRHTTPTWEVELLISGVALFAMLQLPGWLDERLFSLAPRLDASWGDAARILYVYLTGAAVILAATFALHLLLRARWIALVGMHSVYPDGIRWEKLRAGPILRASQQARHGDIPSRIEHADNLATTVFAIGVMLASRLLVLSIVLIFFYAACSVAMALTGRTFRALDALLAFTAVVILPYSIASLADRRFGAGMPADSLRAKALAAVFGLYGRIGIGSHSTVVALRASHDGEHRTSILTLAVIAPTVAAVIFALEGQARPERMGQYAWFPDADALPGRSINEAHYDDQRDPLHDPALPFIAGMQSRSPFLQLTIPYRPANDADGVSHACAGKQADARALLDCLQSLRGVMLDGKPLPDLRYDIGSDPRTDRPALVAMIDVRALAPGRHELQVALPPRSGGKGKDDPGFDRIPFWR